MARTATTVNIISRRDAQKFLADVQEENVFWCVDGKVFKNLRELAEGLNAMTDETFSYHCNEMKKDFSNWIRDVIGDKQLAKDLERPMSRAYAAQIVEQRVVYLSARL